MREKMIDVSKKQYEENKRQIEFEKEAHCNSKDKK